MNRGARWLAVVGALTLGVVVLGACGGGESGPKATTDVREVEAFTKVAVTGPLRVLITQGSPSSVSIQTDADLAASVTSTVADGTLTITTPAGFSPRTPTTVTIVTETIEGATIDSDDANTLLTLASIETASLTLEARGQASIQGAGTAQQLALTLEDAGSAQLTALAVGDAVVTNNGSQNAQVAVINSLTVNLTGSGSVFYSAKPASLTVNNTGTGKVEGQG